MVAPALFSSFFVFSCAYNSSRTPSSGGPKGKELNYFSSLGNMDDTDLSLGTVREAKKRAATLVHVPFQG